MPFSTRKEPKIEFLCQPEDEGVIAPSIPAKDYPPHWFRKLPATNPATSATDAAKNKGQAAISLRRKGRGSTTPRVLSCAAGRRQS